MNMDHEKLLDKVSKRYFRHKQLEDFRKILREVIEEAEFRD